jgi:hypothetical protein
MLTVILSRKCDRNVLSLWVTKCVSDTGIENISACWVAYDKVVYRESSFVLILVVMVTTKSIKLVANTRIWLARVLTPLQLQETNHCYTISNLYWFFVCLRKLPIKASLLFVVGPKTTGGDCDRKYFVISFIICTSHLPVLGQSECDEGCLYLTHTCNYWNLTACKTKCSSWTPPRHDVACGQHLYLFRNICTVANAFISSFKGGCFLNG